MTALRIGLLGLALLALAEPVGAQIHTPQGHTGHGGTARSDMARAREALYRDNGGQTLGGARLDLAEGGDGVQGGDWRLEGSAWTGGDISRVRVGVRAAGSGGSADTAEVEVSYVRAFDPWWNLQVGLGKDFGGDGPAYLSAGVEGLAPYWVHTSAELRVDERGHLGARFEAASDQRLTRRLILQPRVEAGLRLDGGIEAEEAEAGLRLRYEIRPEFAPYVGWVWSHHAGEAPGESARSGSGLVAGLTAWF
ncbi:MAG: copper resistance protein B [Phenylobacterium sp.]|uniref:copper resistance protein B n=1 Tax=Phenylobacterium sp. TaxID=1871053 RepID=UPI003019D0F5